MNTPLVPVILSFCLVVTGIVVVAAASGRVAIGLIVTCLGILAFSLATARLWRFDHRGRRRGGTRL